jgi:hypothetical protein
MILLNTWQKPRVLLKLMLAHSLEARMTAAVRHALHFESVEELMTFLFRRAIP